MRKFRLGAMVAAFAMVVPALPASAHILKVKPSDPSLLNVGRVKVFDGNYTSSDASGDTKTRSQAGYLMVTFTGLEACNGNAELGSPASAVWQGSIRPQGYVWVGSAHAASNPMIADPSGTVGAGNGDTDGDGVYEEGEGEPCPEENDDLR